MATKGIWISAEIMQDKNLTQTEKFILAEIEQLSSLEDGCYAQNSHFSSLTGIAKVTVSRAISTLTEKGYITTKIENGSRNHNRMIRVNKMIRPPIQNDKTPLTKRQETKENKQSNKHINKHPFSFSLKRKTSYDNLSEEYKEKLYGACMLIDGKEDRYEGFVNSCRANDYKYKSFPLAYMNWDKEKAYKNFNPDDEPNLGEGWKRIMLGNGEVLAVNENTYEVKRGRVS